MARPPPESRPFQSEIEATSCGPSPSPQKKFSQRASGHSHSERKIEISLRRIHKPVRTKRERVWVEKEPVKFRPPPHTLDRAARRRIIPVDRHPAVRRAQFKSSQRPPWRPEHTRLIEPSPGSGGRWLGRCRHRIRPRAGYIRYISTQRTQVRLRHRCCLGTGVA